MVYLELIIGPMFSGKTKRLIEQYTEILKLTPDTRPIAVNYSKDTRYGAGKIVSHDGRSIRSICIDDLEDLTKPEYVTQFQNATHIFINEAQFFPKLKAWTINVVDNMKKNVIMCGLDLDFERKNFGELMDLSFRANKLMRMYGECAECQCPSVYTHRLSNETTQVIIGAANYIPVCEECYVNLNRHKQSFQNDALDHECDHINHCSSY